MSVTTDADVRGGPAADALPAISIGDSAVRRLAKMMEKDPDANQVFRVSVQGGGCSGFQYSFSFDDKVKADDRVFERDGIKVVVDEMSLEFLDGSQVQYREELVGSYFALDNPNATSSCGCGSSFSI
jgi:iron-sulfur cluster insertion protein